MSLAVTVGLIQMFERAGDEDGAEYSRTELDRLAGELERAGVRGYREPDRVPPTMRRHQSSLPYSMLHYLRRVYALLCEEHPITPTDDPRADDDIVDDAGSMLTSHLLCHADASGYYVPVDFEEPLYLEESEQLVGSSQRLLAELLDVGPHIGVRLEPDGSLSDDEAARLADYPDGEPYWREIEVWLTLHEACVASIAHGAAIVFH